MGKYFRVLLLISLFAGILVACDSVNEDVNTAVEYIEALNQEDLETARGYVCEERADDITAAMMSVIDQESPFSFQNVSCSGEADEVTCRYTIMQETGDADAQEQQFDRNVIFEFDDGEICGFEQGAALE